MFSKILDSIKSIFSGNKPNKTMITPNWGQQGYDAAQQIKNLPIDELGMRRELENAFEKLYQDHCRACGAAKMRGAIRKVAFDRFKAGWNKQLKG